SLETADARSATGVSTPSASSSAAMGSRCSAPGFVRVSIAFAIASLLAASSRCVVKHGSAVSLCYHLPAGNASGGAHCALAGAVRDRGRRGEGEHDAQGALTVLLHLSGQRT